MNRRLRSQAGARALQAGSAIALTDAKTIVVAAIENEAPMSIFGTIMSKVFGSGHPAASGATPATPTAAGAPASPAAAPTAGAPASADAPSTAPVDVAAILDGMEGGAGQELDWRHSIVDLMKLLHLDSSLTARKQLAGELHYTGDTNDSATMNMWLHKEVMAKFSANGGKLPADMAH